MMFPPHCRQQQKSNMIIVQAFYKLLISIWNKSLSLHIVHIIQSTFRNQNMGQSKEEEGEEDGNITEGEEEVEENKKLITLYV